MSHLLFADDIILFFKASLDQALVMKHLLKKYEMGTCQLLSPPKCSIMFGKSCSLEDQILVMVILKVVADSIDDKYLGLPVQEGRMKAGKFQSIKDEFLKRGEDWTEKYLSGVGIEILVKSVLQALPTYAMGVFKFPTNLCDDLSHMIWDFWWGDEKEWKKVHWIAWNKTIKPK